MEKNTDNTGLTWDVTPFVYDGDGDPNEIIELTVTLPKISPEKRKALDELKKNQAELHQRFLQQLNKTIEDYTKELHQKYPELKGRSLQELGIVPHITFGNGGLTIEFKAE